MADLRLGSGGAAYTLSPPAWEVESARQSTTLHALLLSAITFLTAAYGCVEFYALYNVVYARQCTILQTFIHSMLRAILLCTMTFFSVTYSCVCIRIVLRTV